MLLYVIFVYYYYAINTEINFPSTVRILLTNMLLYNVVILYYYYYILLA